MSTGFWGKKIGMTQVFDGDVVVPVTAITLANWLVVGVRTAERDGHNAFRVGCVRMRYSGKPFSQAWLRAPKKHFEVIREIPVDAVPDDVEIGKSYASYLGLEVGDRVAVAGKTRGRGFAGVVKRHNFGGPPGSHGATMGKKPGSIGFMCSQGRVIKGKKMPGRMGGKQRSIRNLLISRVMQEDSVVLVKGAIPGHAGSIVFVKKMQVGR